MSQARFALSCDLFIDGKFILLGELMDRQPRVRPEYAEDGREWKVVGKLARDAESATSPSSKPTNRLGS